MYIYTYVYMYTYTYVYIYMCVYMYINIYDSAYRQVGWHVDEFQVCGVGATVWYSVSVCVYVY